MIYIYTYIFGRPRVRRSAGGTVCWVLSVQLGAYHPRIRLSSDKVGSTKPKEERKKEIGTRNMNIIITRLISIRVARCSDDAVVKKRVNSCLLKHLFWREFRIQNNLQNPPEMLSPTRY